MSTPNNKISYLLVLITTPDEVVTLSLLGFNNLTNELNNLITNISIPAYQPIEVLVAVMDNTGRTINHKRHLLSPGLPITTIAKRVYYSVVMLIKQFGLNTPAPSSIS